jgi:2-dehydropantoate 2-reductase
MSQTKTILLTNQLELNLEIEINSKFKFKDEISKETLGDCDIILVCVETTQTESIAKELKKCLKEGACVLSLQNGIGNAEILKEQLEKQFVLPTIVFFNVVKKEPIKKDQIHFHNGTGDMMLKFSTIPILGEKLPEKYLQWIENRQIENALRTVCLKEDFINHQHHKLVINLMGSINCLSGKTIIETLVF